MPVTEVNVHKASRRILDMLRGASFADTEVSIDRCIDRRRFISNKLFSLSQVASRQYYPCLSCVLGLWPVSKVVVGRGPAASANYPYP